MNPPAYNNSPKAKINPRVAELIKKISKKYKKVWQDLAKV